MGNRDDPPGIFDGQIGRPHGFDPVGQSLAALHRRRENGRIPGPPPRFSAFVSTLKIIRFPSPREAAQQWAAHVTSMLQQSPEAVLLLPAGRTPVPLYAQLVAQHRGGELDLARTHLFQLDELIGVPPTDPRSFQYFLHEHLFGPAELSVERAHLLDGSARDPAAEIANHRQALRELGGGDLALLGIGRNGHVAFNEPGSRLEDGGREVVLAEMTLSGLRHEFDESELPTRGITLGMQEIAGCARVVLLATGESKAKVIAELATGEMTQALPASLLCDHPSFDVLVDEAAASEL